MQNIIVNISKTIRNPRHIVCTKVIESSTFPGGEEHVRIKADDEITKLLCESKYVTLIGDMSDSKGFMKTIMLTDALRSFSSHLKVDLIAPYFPYARQDRRMMPGEPLSIKVFTNLINQQKYNNVVIFDSHSHVTPALINNVLEYTTTRLVQTVYNSLLDLHKINKEDIVLISPDAGAEKKVIHVARHISHPYVLCCTKQRDVIIGIITKTVVPEYDLEGKTCVIIDDIIDGGMTFIQISKVLKSRGAAKVLLIVSHGIFSNGHSVMKDYIDHIYTTDSCNDIKTDYVTTLSLFDMLLGSTDHQSMRILN
jgi:ribose-phosphate pyrophosphokinase